MKSFVYWIKLVFAKSLIRVSHFLPKPLYLWLWKLSKRLSIKNRKYLFILEKYERLDDDLLRIVTRNNGITLYTEMQKPDPDSSREKFYREQIKLLIPLCEKRGLMGDESLQWTERVSSMDAETVAKMAKPQFDLDSAPAQTLQLIRERRSVRYFSSKRVSDEAVHQILEAGRWAPSSSNRQAWKFVVEKQEKSRHISNLNAAAQSNPDVKIYVLIDERYYSEASACALDAGAIIQNMLLMATALNLGSCWVYHGDSVKQKRLQKKFKVSPFHHIYSAVYLGHPAQIFPAPAKKSFGDDVIFLNR